MSLILLLAGSAAAEEHSGTGSLALAAAIAGSGAKSTAGADKIAAIAAMEGIGTKAAFGADAAPVGGSEGSGGLTLVAVLSDLPVTLMSDADGITPLTTEDGVTPLFADLPISEGVKDALGAGAMVPTVVLGGIGTKVVSGTAALAASGVLSATGARAGSGAGALVLAAVMAGSGAPSGEAHSGVGALTLAAILAGTGSATTATLRRRGSVNLGARVVRPYQPPMLAHRTKHAEGAGILTIHPIMSGAGRASDPDEWALLDLYELGIAA